MCAIHTKRNILIFQPNFQKAPAHLVCLNKSTITVNLMFVPLLMKILPLCASTDQKYHKNNKQEEKSESYCQRDYQTVLRLAYIEKKSETLYFFRFYAH